MVTIANRRAEKAPRKEAQSGKRRRQQLDRVLVEIRKRHKLKGTPEKRARLADHRDLYGLDGLPRCRPLRLTHRPSSSG
ncbi:MAG: hypothetical protein FJX11_06160 [Alphaproteobacteria bacterium]|nr:hypothetical protein [Alphaproteobacteria bacterium]